MRVIVVEIESSEEEALANRRDERAGPISAAKDGVQLLWWGSDCTGDDGCGNTTPESMVCDECNSDAHTRPLWIEEG